MKINDILAGIFESDDENRNISKAPEPGRSGDKVSTKTAAKMAGVTPSRIRQKIADGEMSAKGPTVGQRDNLVSLKDVRALKAQRAQRKNKKKARDNASD